MKIIIVDDDRELSDLLKKAIWVAFYAKAKALVRERQQLTDGLDIQQFDSPQAALDHLADGVGQIDIIFTELRASEQRWLNFIRVCRDQHHDKYRVLMMVTEKGRQQEIEQGLAAGAEGCILKPFTPEDLIQHIFKV